MKIKKELPPIINDIFDAGLKPTTTTVYTYGDTIYSPHVEVISDDVMAQEEVHMAQQGDLPDAWWSRYLDDPFFRLEQEAEAYAVQYNFLCKTRKDRNDRMRILIHFSNILSGPIYGETVTPTAARKIIEQHARKKR